MAISFRRLATCCETSPYSPAIEMTTATMPRVAAKVPKRRNRTKLPANMLGPGPAPSMTVLPPARATAVWMDPSVAATSSAPRATTVSERGGGTCKRDR